MIELLIVVLLAFVLLSGLLVLSISWSHPANWQKRRKKR